MGSGALSGADIVVVEVIKSGLGEAYRTFGFYTKRKPMVAEAIKQVFRVLTYKGIWILTTVWF